MDRFSNNLRKSHRSARASSSSMDSSVSSSYSSNNSNLNQSTRKSFPNHHHHHRQQSNDINASFSSSSVAGSIQVCGLLFTNTLIPLWLRKNPKKFSLRSIFSGLHYSENCRRSKKLAPRKTWGQLSSLIDLVDHSFQYLPQVCSSTSNIVLDSVWGCWILRADWPMTYYGSLWDTSLEIFFGNLSIPGTQFTLFTVQYVTYSVDFESQQIDVDFYTEWLHLLLSVITCNGPRIT